MKNKTNEKDIYRSNYCNFCLKRCIRFWGKMILFHQFSWYFSYIDIIYPIDYNIQIDYISSEAVHKVFNHIMSIETSNKDLYLWNNDGLYSDKFLQPSIRHREFYSIETTHGITYIILFKAK